MKRAEPPTTVAKKRFFSLTTNSDLINDKREFWRQTALNRSVADFRPELRHTEFNAMVWGYAAGKCEMRFGQCDAIIMSRTPALARKDGGDEILLSAFTAIDDPRHQDINGTSVKIAQGNILVYDLAAPFRVDLGRYSEVNFRLKRDLVRDAIAKDPACLGGHVLSPTHLNKLLFSQLQAVAAALPDLTDHGRDAALESLADFALAALRVEVQGGTLQETEQVDWLWDASQRFIAANLGQARMTAASVAQALNCSRAHLYRLFASRGQTVMGYVQEQRLATSRRLLARYNGKMTVAEIAFRCGFEDPSAFTRSFRRRFGCPPSALLKQAPEV